MGRDRLQNGTTMRHRYTRRQRPHHVYGQGVGHASEKVAHYNTYLHQTHVRQRGVRVRLQHVMLLRNKPKRPGSGGCDGGQWWSETTVTPAKVSITLNIAAHNLQVGRDGDVQGEFNVEAPYIGRCFAAALTRSCRTHVQPATGSSTPTTMPPAGGVCPHPSPLPPRKKTL